MGDSDALFHDHVSGESWYNQQSDKGCKIQPNKQNNYTKT